ncbi:hypothetical protein BASA81_004219 [Batrachochytrium salamandrivorans]|nr:hypothetical protein BASA81_004219 [Batrachochytrium salamandrivorans]
MRALGLTETKEEIKSLAEKLANAQQQIPLDAFMDLCSERIANRDPKQEMERAFGLFDEERTGKITLQVLRKVARDLGEVNITDQELEEMIAEADTNGDGEVTMEDFCKLMQASNLYG